MLNNNSLTVNDVTLVIPTRNNLKYVKSAYTSIRKYIGNDVHIVILDDASSDDTWKWCNEIYSVDSRLEIYRNEGSERVGHCILYDVGASLANTLVFGIFHADMIATPNYVNNLLKHLKKGTVVSATRIEPPLHPGGVEKIVRNFGLEPEDFKELDFLEFVRKSENDYSGKTANGIFAPWMMYVSDFFAIGGHDKLFAPMELEDSDIFNRFYLMGYELIQSWDAFVYHMTCRGSRFKEGLQIENEIRLSDGTTWYKPKDSEEYKQLRQVKFREWWRKWGMNVLHDSKMLPIVKNKYNISFVVKNIYPSLLEFLEPWCDRIYIDNETVASDYIKKEQLKSLFDISKRVLSVDSISSDASDYGVLVTFDGKNFQTNHIEVIQTLSDIIEKTNDIGRFEWDIFNFEIFNLTTYQRDRIPSDFLTKNGLIYKK